MFYIYSIATGPAHTKQKPNDVPGCITQTTYFHPQTLIPDEYDEV